MIIPSIKKLIQSKPAKVLVEIIKTSTGYARRVTIKPSPSPKPTFTFIITDDQNGYWSEEEGGRFSQGALYERVFYSKKEANSYIKKHGIKGTATPHSEHWTGSMPILYDSNKHKPGKKFSSN